MEYIKDKTGDIVMAFDDDNLFYLSVKSDGDSKLNESALMNLFINGETEYISNERIMAEKSGGLKLFTILNLLEELDIISDKKFIIKKIKKTIPYLAQILIEHEKSISLLSKRIVLLEIEGSGPASAWMDYLFLIKGNKTFDLCSSRRDYLSASEKIGYYGLGESEYWDQVQANGEFIEEVISEIKSVEELYEGIVLLLKKEEQCNLNEDDIDWVTIVDALLHNNASHKLGIEIKSMVLDD